MNTTKKAKREYAVIDGIIVNEECEEIVRLGGCLFEIKMASPAEIEQAIREKIPGCGFSEYVKYVPTIVKLPGIGKLYLECEEYPIEGDYGNGWTVCGFINRY
jgi:hypothetical protein